MENVFYRYARRPYRVALVLMTVLTLVLGIRNLELVLSHAGSPVSVSIGRDLTRLKAGDYVSIDYLYMFDTGYYITGETEDGPGEGAQNVIQWVYLAELEDDDYLIVLLDRPQQAEAYMGDYTGRLVSAVGVWGEVSAALAADIEEAWGLTNLEARRLLHAHMMMETVTDTGAHRILPMWITVSGLGIVCLLLLAVVLYPRMTRAYRRLAEEGSPYERFAAMDRALDRGEALIDLPGFVAAENLVLMQKWLVPAGKLVCIYDSGTYFYRLRFILADGTRGALRISPVLGDRIMARVRRALPDVMVGRDDRLAKMQHQDLLGAWEIHKMERPDAEPETDGEESRLQEEA